MITTPSIEENLNEAYAGGGKAVASIFEIIAALLKKGAEKDPKIDDLSIESTANDRLNYSDLTVESNVPSNGVEYDGLTVESNAPVKKKTVEKERVGNVSEQDSEPKMLFKRDKDGFINDLNPAQEAGIGKMLIGKPGTQIPGAESLTIRYKGEIIASTNAQGIVEVNTIHDKIPAETLEKLAKEIEKIASTKEASTPKPVVPIVDAGTRPVVPIPAPVPMPVPIAAPVPVAAKSLDIQPAGMVPENLKLNRPKPRAPITEGDPRTHIQSQLAAVEKDGNGVGKLAANLDKPVEPTLTTSQISAKEIVGTDAQQIKGQSKIKAAEMMDWVRANTSANQPETLTPKGNIAKLDIAANGAETYTLSSPDNKILVSGTRNLETGNIEMTKYDPDSVKDWQAMKQVTAERKKEAVSIPSVEPIAPVAVPKPVQKLETAEPIAANGLTDSAAINPPMAGVAEQKAVDKDSMMNIKSVVDKYHMQDDKNERMVATKANKDVALGYERIDDMTTQYAVIDRADPSKQIVFNYSEETREITPIQNTTTPSMLDIVQKTNAHMESMLNGEIAASNKVAHADRETPNTSSINPAIPQPAYIPLSSVPVQTSQPAKETTKTSQKQSAVLAKSILLTDKCCEMYEADTASLTKEVTAANGEIEDAESVRVSVRKLGKDTKAYTLEDMEDGSKSEFTHNEKTGEIEVIKEGSESTVLKLEAMFETAIPDYASKVEVKTKAIEETTIAKTQAKATVKVPALSGKGKGGIGGK